MRPRFAALLLSALPAVIPLASSIAQAGPSRPGDGKVQSPLVGRVQTREGVFDLTREALLEDGPASQLAPAVAHVLAEASDALDTKAADDAR